MGIRVFSVLFLFNWGLHAAPANFSLRECEKKSDSIFKEEPETQLIPLVPKGVLVAREARFFVQSHHAAGYRLQSFQSFLNSKQKSSPRIVCGSSEMPLKTRFSMLAPTLIDTDTEKPRNAFWQFQIVADETLISPWNTRSLAVSSSDPVEKLVEKLGYNMKINKLSPHSYEIIFLQKTAEHSQALSMIYDLL